MYQVTRDGVPIGEPHATYNEAFAAIHRLQSQSVDWAMKYEGYAIVEVA